MPANRRYSEPSLLKARLLTAIFGIAAAMLPTAADCRNVWDINHGMSNPPAAPGAQWHGPTVNKFDPSFWKGQIGKTIPAGTVLTAILEKDISSKKSKAGDVFTLTLQDGFSLNGNVLIPPNSKIVGTVNRATPAKNLRGGMPGRIEISLQSLVYPDGRHQQIFAFLANNPNAKHKEPSVRQAGANLRDYGDQLLGMGLSFISGPGFMAARRNRGLDFLVEKGEALPVKLNQDLVPMPVQTVVSTPSGNSGPGGVPASGTVPASAPNYLDPNGPIRIPGFVPTTQDGAPSVPGNMPAGSPGTAMTQPPADQNAIFNQPLSPPSLSNTADPF